MQWPYAAIEFDQHGSFTNSEQHDKVLDLVRGRLPGQSAPPRDLVVMAHGWNNGRDAAEQLFTELGDNMADVALRNGADPERFAVVGIKWPSIRWADEDQLVGGAVSIGDERSELDVAITDGVEDAVLAARLRSLSHSLEESAAARSEFVECLRPTVGGVDTDMDEDPIPPAFLNGDVEELFASVLEAERDVESADGDWEDVDRADAGPSPFSVPSTGAHLGDPIRAAAWDVGGVSMRRIARRLLNFTTYYKMKKRSRVVGERGLVLMLDRWVDVSGSPPINLHLVGHSFGARLVTSAAAKTDHHLSSMSLLQAAFSHRSFADSGKPGAFRTVLDGPLVGPCIVTHTHNDKAILYAYAVASRMAGHVSAGIGDANDPYGGLGANGALATSRADKARLEGARHMYSFSRRRISNLLADEHITDHSCVRNEAVANAVLQAVVTGSGVSDR